MKKLSFFLIALFFGIGSFNFISCASDSDIDAEYSAADSINVSESNTVSDSTVESLLKEPEPDEEAQKIKDEQSASSLFKSLGCCAEESRRLDSCCCDAVFQKYMLMKKKKPKNFVDIKTQDPYLNDCRKEYPEKWKEADDLPSENDDDSLI